MTLPTGANVGSYKPHSVLRLLPTFFQVRASLFSATQVPLSPRHLRMLFRLVRTGICTPYSNRSRADIHHHPPSHRGCSRLHSKPPALSLNTMSGREDILLRAHRHTSSLHITHPTTPLHYTHEAHEGRGQCIGYGECVKATSPPLAGSLRWQRLTPVPQHTSEASSPGTYPFRRYRSTASPCSPLRDEQ